MKNVTKKPKTPRHGLAAMRAMGSSRDMALAAKTFQYICDEARDQDTSYYGTGLRSNPRTRRFLADKYKEHYAEVCRSVWHGYGCSTVLIRGVVVREALCRQLYDDHFVDPGGRAVRERGRSIGFLTSAP